MARRISEIAAALGAEAVGNVDLAVERPQEPASSGVNDLALAMSARYAGAVAATKAKAAILWKDADWQALGLEAAILVERPRLAMAHLTQSFDTPDTGDGVSELAKVSAKAHLYEDVSVGPFTTIADAAVVGVGTLIASHVSIAEGAKIGRNCQVHPGVRIGRNVLIGDNVVLQPNVVVGADGFSFVTEGLSNEERAFISLAKEPLSPPDDAIRHRIHSLGSVVIGDDVEIGANSTVDAGTIRPTSVGRGTKIDNLVQVGHNVVVGEDCVLCAQAAVAGSTVIGDRSVLGGKSGVKDNVVVGKDVVLGGGAIVLGNVDDGHFVMGYPAVDMLDHRAQMRGLKSLPALLKRLRNG